MIYERLERNLIFGVAVSYKQSSVEKDWSALSDIVKRSNSLDRSNPYL